MHIFKLFKTNLFSLIKERIVEYVYKKFGNSRGNPLFSIIDQVQSGQPPLFNH